MFSSARLQGFVAPSLAKALTFSTLVFLGICTATMESSAAEPAIQLLGKGVQIYTCVEAGQVFAWKLKAPDAVLTDMSGAIAGHHFAGPTWQAIDGSAVVGAPLAADPAPKPGSIPWLILGAKAHSGAGRFADIAYVVRSQTEGGVAPSAGCDPAHAGGETRVSYSATYLFFPGDVRK